MIIKDNHDIDVVFQYIFELKFCEEDGVSSSSAPTQNSYSDPFRMNSYDDEVDLTGMLVVTILCFDHFFFLCEGCGYHKLQS